MDASLRFKSSKTFFFWLSAFNVFWHVQDGDGWLSTTCFEPCKQNKIIHLSFTLNLQKFHQWTLFKPSNFNFFHWTSYWSFFQLSQHLQHDFVDIIQLLKLEWNSYKQVKLPKKYCKFKIMRTEHSCERTRENLNCLNVLLYWLKQFMNGYVWGFSQWLFYLWKKRNALIN